MRFLPIGLANHLTVKISRNSVMRLNLSGWFLHSEDYTAMDTQM